MKIAEKKLTEKIIEHYFFGNWEESFRTSGKKIQSSSEKVSSEKAAFFFFLPKGQLEKRDFFVEKQAVSLQILRPKQSIQVFCRNIFSAVFSDDYARFSEDISRIFFLEKKKIFFLFVLPSNSLIWWENCSIAVKGSF